MPFRLKFLAAPLACAALCISIKTQSQTPYYEESVAASNPIRTEQAQELDGYIKRLKADKSRLNALLQPDYSSEKAFIASTKRFRLAFERSIGYPPPGSPDNEPPVFNQIGEDAIGTYYRVKISVLPGVHAVGIYIAPKGAKGRVPLVISMHGGGGSPEVALFHGGGNYHDMVRGAAKRGYAVFAPTHLFFAEGFPRDVRNSTDERMRLVGTSLTAVEVAKISRSLDVLLKRPEIDPKRVAMVGLSYGGYYTLVATALEPRIKVAVSSCYYGVQEGRYEQSETGIPSDFRFHDRFTLFNDSELTALICPRPLEIQAGKSDAPSHREMGKRLAPKSAEYYQGLGKSDNFRFVLFDGGHDFWDATAWEWVGKHFGKGR